MCDFEWTGELTAAERNALRGYKDDTWIEINPGLRSENLADALQQQVQLLDQAIQKGKCTRALTLFRATGLNRLAARLKSPKLVEHSAR